LFDFKYLSETKPDFNWDLVMRNILQTKTYAQALLAVKFVNKIIPETLPEELLTNDTINNKFTKYYNKVMFHRFYFYDLRTHCRNLKIKDALKSIKIMKDYLAKKPKYFLLKRVVRKSDFLIKIFLVANSKAQ
jgi:hypothetical protein